MTFFEDHGSSIGISVSKFALLGTQAKEHSICLDECISSFAAFDNLRGSFSTSFIPYITLELLPSTMRLWIEILNSSFKCSQEHPIPP